MNPHLHLDTPLTQPLFTPWEIKGWLTADRPPDSLSAYWQDHRIPLEIWAHRPDVEAAYPSSPWSTGFSTMVELWPAPRKIVFEARWEGTLRTWEFNLPEDPLYHEKVRRMELIRPLLDFSRPHRDLGHAIDFLTEEERQSSGADLAAAVSAHPYVQPMEEKIRSSAPGWILDCGAGRRPGLHDQVVNYEIAPYPTTDVRGVAESLPFRDGVFAGILCLSVLEHVRDPARCVAEMTRVLAPGGWLWIDAAFCQPYHGYPHHYCNFTPRGLETLCSPDLEIEEQRIPRYGHPVYALTWMVRQYYAQLDGDAQRQFGTMRVEDLLQPAESYLECDWVRDLPASAREELAATSTLIARKKPAVRIPAAERGR